MRYPMYNFNEKKQDVIKCPCCGAEYLPAEIYLPNSFFGKPKVIIKDHMTGKIDEYSGSDMDKVEHYVCDMCNTPFKIVTKIQFNTYVESEKDFNHDYETELKKQAIFLDEEL